MKPELSVQLHCRYLNLFLGNLSYKECTDKGILELHKILDPNEEYFHIEGSEIWRISPWKKLLEQENERKRQHKEEMDRLDERRRAYYVLLEGLAKEFKGMDNVVLRRLAETLMNTNNAGAVAYFTGGKIDLNSVPTLNRNYTNLDSGLKLTTT